MGMKRLLAVYPFLPYPPNFGGRIRCFHLLDRLRQRFEIEVAALTIAEDIPERIRGLGEKVAGIFPVPSPAQTSPCRRQKLKNTLSSVPWELPLRSTYLEQLVYERSAKVDVVFLYSARLFHLERCARSRAIISDVDDLPHTTLYKRIERMKGIKKRLGYTLELLKTIVYELKALRRFDMVLVTNEKDVYRIHRWKRNLPIRVVPNGVNIEYFAFNSNAPNPEKVILFLGALDYEPNERAMEWLCTSIFPKIRRRMPETRLRLVGRNPSRLVHSLIAAGIELASDVPDVRPYLQECSVVAVPLTMGGGSRIKILEAAASGRPVVSTSAGAEGLNFIPGVEIEIADKEGEFVEKTIDLLSNRDRALTLAKHARLRVEREYTWEMSWNKLEDAISPWL
jgi:glycosyltransferase involved in cell wall biosynthesis